MTLFSPVKLTSPYSAQYGVMTIHNKIFISFIIFFGKILLIMLKKAKKNQKNEKYNVVC